MQSQEKAGATWDLTGAQQADLWLILSGAFRPIERFSSEPDATTSIEKYLDSNGNVLPFPIPLTVSRDFADRLQPGQSIVLRHPEGIPLARMSEISRAPSASPEDPVQLGGKLEALKAFPPRAFPELHRKADSFRNGGKRNGKRFGYFTGRFPVAQVIESLAEHANSESSELLILVSANIFDASKRANFSLVKAWLTALAETGHSAGSLVLCPVRSDIEPTRKALAGAIAAQNYGCTHYLAEEADELMRLSVEAGNKLSIVPVKFKVQDRSSSNDIVSVKVVNDGVAETIETLRACADDIALAFPPPNQQGFTVFFTGLPASGKSTLANALILKLMERTNRPVTLLDGDIVRKHLSSELGYSREHRDLNITRIGFVASEITKHGGIAVCAPIAPFAKARAAVRELVTREGGYVEVHVSTPQEVCEARDPKGLYALARAGVIKDFTGVNDPYEEPESPEIRIDTSETTVADAIGRIVSLLLDRGHIEP